LEQGNIHEVLCPVTFVLDGYAGIDIHVRVAVWSHATIYQNLGVEEKLN
jgi:hypothetical protein